MPKELVKKYEWAHRKNVDKLPKCMIIVGGIFLTPLRLVMWILGLAIINLTCRLFSCCENLKEPPPNSCFKKFINRNGQALG